MEMNSRSLNQYRKYGVHQILGILGVCIADGVTALQIVEKLLEHHR